MERISAAAKHLGIDGDVVPFGSHTNTLPGISGNGGFGDQTCENQSDIFIKTSAFA